MLPGTSAGWPRNAVADALFPFHLLMDRSLVLRSIGPSLAVMYPRVAVGDTFDGHFRLVRPPVPIEWTALREHQRALFVVQDESGKRLRGQFIAVDDDHLAFLGSPLVNSLRYLEGLGLSASHFAVHDSSLDYLLLLESSHTVLADSIRVEAALRQEHAELEAAHDQLERLNDELREASALQADFLAGVSHELRAPLHAILGSTEVIEEWDAQLTPEKRRALVQTVRTAANQLLHLVDDLLDSAAMSSGRVRLVATTQPAAAVIRRALEIAARAAGGVRIVPQTDLDALDAQVHVDGVRIVQVLVNLLTNAVVHSPPDTPVTVAARGEGGRLLIAVTDRGPGIPEGQQERIFEKFVRLTDTHAAPRGLGLGLYISRTLARLHRGDLSVSSTPGEGSTFTLSLPLAGGNSM